MPVFTHDEDSTGPLLSAVVCVRRSRMRPIPRVAPEPKKTWHRLYGFLLKSVVVNSPPCFSPVMNQSTLLVYTVHGLSQFSAPVNTRHHEGNVIRKAIVFDTPTPLRGIRAMPSTIDTAIPFFRFWQGLVVPRFFTILQVRFRLAGRSSWARLGRALTLRVTVRLAPFRAGREDTLVVLTSWPACVRPRTVFLSPQLTPMVVGPCPVSLKANRPVYPSSPETAIRRPPPKLLKALNAVFAFIVVANLLYCRVFAAVCCVGKRETFDSMC